MRINRYVAASSGVSRRQADSLIKAGRVSINGRVANLGDEVESKSIVKLDERIIKVDQAGTLVLFNKPVGIVCSRKGQNSKTVYALLPKKYLSLKLVGRLDKDSSGLLLLTNNGKLANTLMHPRYGKQKTYLVELTKTITDRDIRRINRGVMLADGQSHLALAKIPDSNKLKVTMKEGRNRQIRRTFDVLNYKVKSLERIEVGNYTLNGLKPGQYKEIKLN